MSKNPDHTEPRNPDFKYGWGRLQTEASVIAWCEKLGAVPLGQTVPPPKLKPHSAKERRGVGFGDASTPD